MLTELHIRGRLDALVKPVGSFGRLERLATDLCLIQQTLQPHTTPRRLLLFAADHGVVAERVSSWPQVFTRQMVEAILAGGAACSILARSTNTQLRVIDVGMSSEIAAKSGLFRSRRIRAATRNLAVEPAMTIYEFRDAAEVGREQAEEAYADGCRVVVAGEMGVGNSTVASCLIGLLTDQRPEELVGPGAGADDAMIGRKRRIVAEIVLRLRKQLSADPELAIAACGGLEIAAMAGFFHRARERQLTVVLDGFIATSAALVAERLWPGTARVMIAAHQSAEPGHSAALRSLNLKPMLDWDLRLGEGTGALLLLPLLDAASAMITDMMTFEQAGFVFPPVAG